MTADALRLLAEKFNLTPCSGDPSVLVKVRDDKRAYGVLNTAFGGLRLRLKWGCPFVRRPSLICMRLMPLKQKRTGSIPHVL
jgi:hypothetical protein